MLNNYNNEDIILDNKDVKLSDILSDRKYRLLLKCLNANNLYVSNDIKNMTQQDYDRLKTKIPNISGIGPMKIDLYFKKMDEIRKENNEKYFRDENSEVNNDLIVALLLGRVQTSKSYTIDINKLKYVDGSEYLDIRKVKNDGSRKNGISIKKENIPEFIEIINNYYNDDYSDEE